MKHFNNTIGYAYLLLSLSRFCANGDQSVSNESGTFIVGSNFVVTVSGQSPTDRILGCNVARHAGGRVSDQRSLIFAPDSKQALLARSTNRVYFFNGKLFRIVPGIEQVWVVKARPLRNLEAAEIVRAADEASKDVSPNGSHYNESVDLRPALGAETQLPLAQPRILKSADAKLEDGKIVIYFESVVGIKGKVVLDDRLSPTSVQITFVPSKLMGPPK